MKGIAPYIIVLLVLIISFAITDSMESRKAVYLFTYHYDYEV